MWEGWVFLGLLALWLALQFFLLPRMGIST
jgi:hypothetical protein